ncbi:ABC transporter ATP-binding protein [Microvenator marinus]|uniref:ABC transporter ATP-binding protein n=1 Tax=Microvenator marinus TaxID=2600177 RepID=A0A5B8XW46_9DELT|nr:ABC transporter ATP-binding protein [Microvenator marinus]QED29644.1 ABC transporter ATP-binding protein [Microvenator marinus]
MTIIKAKDVHKIYVQGEVEVNALRGVSVDFEEGEFSVLAGPSGSGKTTLLNMIGSLDDPTRGEVWVGSKDITKLSPSESAKYRLEHIGFVFQAYNLLPVLSAYENAEFILMLQGMKADERRKIVLPLMERVGLADLVDRKPNQLSGGQQQRVAVVRAIASKPLVVLADEPTANLDSKTSESLLDLMLELNKEEGVTFVFSSHDDLVLERARRVIRLDSGQVVGDEVR